MRFVMITLGLCLLAACSGAGKELPVVKASDPTWQLVPDRLEYGMLPR